MSYCKVHGGTDFRGGYCELWATEEGKGKGPCIKVEPVGECEECGEPTYPSSIRPWACSSRCYADAMGIGPPDY